MHGILVLAIGYLAQILFGARVIVQWWLSEKSNRVLSPTLFWSFSLAGSALFCVYGWMCNDFTIIFGQIISYYVYIWNLKIKGAWQTIPRLLQLILFWTPFAAACVILRDPSEHFARFFQNADFPVWLVCFGTSGQVLFVLRFVYQWYCSQREGESLFPEGFWWLSIIASIIVLSYAVMVRNEVLIISQFSIVPYIRNLYIMRRQSAKSA